jgi:hypothetical protein
MFVYNQLLGVMSQVANCSQVSYQPELQAEFLVLQAEAETLYCRLRALQEQQRLGNRQEASLGYTLALNVADQSVEHPAMPAFAGASV